VNNSGCASSLPSTSWKGGGHPFAAVLKAVGILDRINLKVWGSVGFPLKESIEDLVS
jgi:hypothetical protein